MRQELLDFHNAHGAEGTLMTTPVEDPSKYGVVCLKPGTTQIERFVEKPQNWVGDQINAGIYIFSPKMLSRVQHVSKLSSLKCNLTRKGETHVH